MTPSLGGPRHRDVVEHADVLDSLAQPDPTGVRAHRDPELRRQQHVGDVLVDPGDAGGIDLHAVRLEQLLEDHAVSSVLSGGHPDRGDGPGDRCVPQDVVRAGRLLHPGEGVVADGLHPGDRLGGDVPPLVGVDGGRDVRSDGFPGQPQASDIVVEVGPDRELDMAETLG